MTYQPKPAKRVSHFIKCEVHGEWGDGKSRFASTFPGPKLWIDPMRTCDHFVIKEGPSPDFTENSQNPETILAALEWATQACRDGAIKTVVLDDVTVLQDQLVFAEAGEGKVPLDRWGPLRRPLARVLTKIAGSPLHFVVTSRASMIAAEESGGRIVGVHKAARPKAWDTIMYAVDFALFVYSVGSELAADKIQFYAQVQKTRGGADFPIKMGQRFADPSFDKVFGQVVAFEGDAPLAEYDDMDAAAEAARKNGNGTMQRLADEQLAVELRAAITSAKSLDELKGAWTRCVTEQDKLGPAFDALKSLKEARKGEVR